MSAPPRESEGAVVATRRQPRSPAFWLILPSIVFMLFLFGYPMVEGVRTAFTGDAGFTLEHAQRMVEDPKFGDAVRNTLLLIVAVIPLQFLLALVMALALQARPKLSGVYFYLWAIPLAVSDLAAGLVWLSIFADRGYLNSVFVMVGLQPVSWLNYESPTTMFVAVTIAEIWRATSLVLVIVVSGMQGIPKDYGEAAAVFGATYWQRLWQVTLPLLRPSLQVALILRTILAFQTFAVAQALTGEAFPLLVGETYRWYSVLHNPHVAAVYALVILGVSMLTAVIYLRLLRDQTTAEAR
ncbi:MAG: sugar ABC transporter permease [Propionicimonas sp.]|uniref:carbohydrate ABC transporter permease n=1 Tax=Propionicimonas sp. TaxID=1955623 RepID=UPI002B1FFD87|nr:sugar ABC transporter permease [Propionicimonas sp.]MEA4944830.1 sugar ABC transporter permease [Propionicimonas sp.]MEA5054172.1 sugar ABC transporter permease [Propionicimonas sp.]MEA5116190.1 sugar ABC transporter permease [Propionicimonas sp.]